MKKIYSFCMIAAIAILASFTAKADVSATVTWDIPGSVILYVGSTAESAKVVPPADATSYEAKIAQTYGTVYVRAAEGYILENAVCQDDNKEITVSSWGTPQIGINMAASQHGGHTVKVNCTKLEYDGKININFVSAGKVTVSFPGTFRTFDLQGGEQSFEISSKYDKTIQFSVPDYKGADGMYFKKNNVEIAYSEFYGSFRQDPIEIANGDNFEVKYNNETPVLPVDKDYKNINITYANDEAKAAVNMIRNLTQNKSINERDAFKVEKGERIRIVFNTQDYDVTVNGQAVESATATYGNWESAEINDDTNINISAAVRQYEPVYISFWVTNPDYITIHDGEMNGEIIDLSEYTSSGSKEVTYTNKVDDYFSETITQSFQKYTVKAGGKFKKVFFGSKDSDHYIKFAGYKEDGDWLTAGIITPESLETIIDARKKNESKKLVVKVDAGGTHTADDVVVKDQAGNRYPVAAGYNEFTVDPDYVNPMQVNAYNLATNGDSFTVYLNSVLATQDSESNAYKGLKLTGYGDIVHVFVGKSAPAKYSVNVYPGSGASAEITVDRITRTAKNAELNYSIYRGTEVTVKPANIATPIYVGGEKIALGADGTYTFSVKANTDIYVGNPKAADMTVTPGEDDTVETFESFLIEFPNATSVEQQMEDVNEMIFQMGQSWANWGFSVEKQGDNAFLVTPNFKYQSNGTYRFYIPEGFFKVNGMFDSAEQDFSFSIFKEASTADIELMYNPTTESIINEGYGLNVAVAVDESLIFEFNTEDINDFKVKLGDRELEYYSEWEYELQYCYFMITVKPDVCQDFEGELSIWVKAGALTVSGAECPEISHSWNVMMPKEYEVTVDNPDVESTPGSIIFTISFPEAKTAEIFNEYGATLVDSDYFSAPAASRASSGVYTQNGKIEEVADASVPSFKITFPTAPSNDGHKYLLKLREGTFTLDGIQGSPEKTFTYTYKANGGLVSGILDAIFDGDANANVFDINGREILRNADAEALNSLRPGIYIINGKKILK